MPEVIDIPEVGLVEFPDGMSDADISTASQRLYGEAAQARISPNAVVNKAIPVDKRIDPAEQEARSRKLDEKDAEDARKTISRSEWADFIIRPFASTAENPLGGIGSAAKVVGGALNAAGEVSANAAKDFLQGVPPLSRYIDGPPAEREGNVVQRGLTEAARMVPTVAGSVAMMSAGVPPTAAFAVPMAAQTFDATGGDLAATTKAGLIGAILPGVGDVGRQAAVKLLGSAVERGLLDGASTMTHKVVEALGAQGTIQVLMEGMNLPEYVAATPEQRTEMFLQNLIANTAFLGMDVPGVLSKRPSATQEAGGGKRMAAAKVGEIMERLVNDPAAVEQLRAAADEAALQATNPRRAGLQHEPPEIANVEPQFVDPNARPMEGREVPVENLRPEILKQPEALKPVENEELAAQVGEAARPQVEEDTVPIGFLPTQADVDAAAGRPVRDPVVAELIPAPDSMLPPPVVAESIDTGALGKAGMGGAKPGEFTGFDTPTSIKNAQVDIERTRRGLPPAIEPLRRSFGTVWDEAMARIDTDPTVQDRLLDELNAKPRAVTDIEDAMLLHKQVELQNEYGLATREMAQAYDDAKLFPNRLEAVEMWKARAQAASDRLLALYNINKSVGTETARGLNARKMMAQEDFTLAAMEMDKRLANEGAPLEPAQRAELEAAHKKITELQTAYDEHVQRAEEERAKRRADDTVREMAQAAAQEPTYDPRILKMAEEIVQKLEKRADAARASVREKLARLNAGVDPTLIYELGVIGAAKIARKGLDLTRFTAEMVSEFGEKVRPFIHDVWASANLYLENEGAKYGDKAEPIRRLLRRRDELGRRENIVAGLKKAHAEGQPVDLLGDYVRRLAESFVRAGVHAREPLVDAVHGVLTAEVDPAITRRETMDAISGYGRFKPLNPDAIKAQLRTLKGEMQQLAKLEDIQNRQPLKKTGVERRLVGDEERRLLAQVNEAKRRFGVVVTDPARQLKSALDSVTTRIKNSIADLEYQIATGARTVKTKTPAPTSPEVELLKARRDQLKAELDTLLPRPQMTDAQRIQIAAKHVERGIADLERRIASRDVSPAQTKRTPPNSPHLEALRARREALKAEFVALRDALDPSRADRVALATVKARMMAQEARYLDRLARGDFAPRARKEVPMDEEALRLKARLQLAKDAWQRGLDVDRLKNRSLLQKAGGAVREALNIPRSVLSSWDFSAVLRQGGFIAMGHPMRAARALPDMFRAWASEERAAMVDQEILSRPNAPRYAQAKLYLAPLDTVKLTKMEEAFMSRLAKSIPGVERSNRAFVTFLNKLRADSFDALVNRMELGGPKLESAELQAVANYINVATGRGDMGRAAAAAETLATVFFSPRLVTSRFQLLAGQPAWRGTSRTRRAVAAEYGRFLAGMAVVYGLANLAGADLESDPRSSDFGKLKFGNTRVDPLGGLSQGTVLLSRLTSGETKTGQSEVKDIRGKVPFGESTSADVIWRFLRSKLAPVPAVALDLASGSNVVGEPVTAGDAAARLVVPLSFSDIYDVMKEQGVPAGTALGMLSVFGFGLQQQPDPDVRMVVGELMRHIRTRNPEEREALRLAYEQQFSTNKAGLKGWADALRQKKQSREAGQK